MRLLHLAPTCWQFDTFAAFADSFSVQPTDLLVTQRFLYERYMRPLNLTCSVLFEEEFGTGEPSDTLANALCIEANRLAAKRIIAVGGGTVLDLAKLLSLRATPDVGQWYSGAQQPVRDKTLVLIPTTCGTGSEVTNISILQIDSLGTKKGLADDQLYADHAVLIPELLTGLPFAFFMYSSIDALVHAMESYVSPRATDTTRLFSERAIQMILAGYQKIQQQGEIIRPLLHEQFLLASHYAGVAFSNANCGAVHALSYPLGAQYHVTHGESNYAFFTAVFSLYQRRKPEGLSPLHAILTKILGCKEADVYLALERMLSSLLVRKPLCAYGMRKEEIGLFADLVIENQQRLLQTAYIPLSRGDIYGLYEGVYY